MGKKKKIYNGKKIIKEFLLDKNYNEDVDSYVDSIIDDLNKNNFSLFNKYNINETDNYISFFIINSYDDCKLITEQIKEQGTINYDLYYFIIFVNNYEIKAKIQDSLKELKKQIIEKFKCKSIDIIFEIIHDAKINKNEFPVKIDSRISSIVMDLKNQNLEKQDNVLSKISSIVCTANLFDLTTIYNDLGDILFNQNVRYKIKDYLDVDKNIKKTLTENPEDFWYLNNGITLIARSKRCINKNSPDKIVLKYNKENDLSIINGAQTIFSATDFFYNPKNNADSSVIEKAKNHAKVLFRIMYQNDNKDDCKKELDKISISLNRQKPIVVEDILYTHNFVFEINKLYEDNMENKFYFYISKRGAYNLIKNHYDLKTFSRAYFACCGKPGKARAQSTNSLLRDLSNNLEKIDEEYFSKNLKPINFLIELGRKYDENNISKDTNTTDDKSVIIQNGRYYFLSFVVNTLKDGDDFKNFHYTGCNIPNNIDKLIDLFVDVVLRTIKSEHIENINSNNFKKENLYESILKKCEDEDKKSIKDIFK